MLIAVAFTVVLPGSTEAAGRGPAVQTETVQAKDIWGLVMSWLFNHLGNGSILTLESSAKTATTPGAVVQGTPCVGDQGVCIDPNG
jgi:hypothetical protein